MKAAVFDEFQGPLLIRDVPVPEVPPDAVLIEVRACGICRSDWHGWMGHDSDVHLPHVPGHELAGIVSQTGELVTKFHRGDRVTVPFSCGCGRCVQCESGNQQICDYYTQPGFTQWGAFAEFVLIRHADVNLVHLPNSIDFVTAASLGCRFATSWRGVVCQGRLSAGEYVAVHGCGGVGLSAIMIASALGGQVIAVDIQENRLATAKSCGAIAVVNASEVNDVSGEIQRLTTGGAHLSIDALGSRQTCYNSIACLRKRGRHIQIGLTLGTERDPAVPMSAVIARELEILGSHGMQAFEYPPMLRLIVCGILQPHLLLGETVSLQTACQILPEMNRFPGQGVVVIDQF